MTTGTRKPVWIVVLSVAAETHARIIAVAIVFIVHGDAVSAIGVAATRLKSFDIAVRLIVPVAVGLRNPV